MVAQKTILQSEIAAGVTVQDLLNAFHDVLDGTQSHDIQANTGLPDADVDRIIKVRNETVSLWEI